MNTKPDKGPMEPSKAGTDWVELRNRLEKAGKSLTGRTVVAKKKILSERARRLAEAVDESGAVASDKNIDVIEFILGREKYAIETSNLREVCPLSNLTPVPCTPAFVLGIINFRGQMVSIIDLGKFFDMPDHSLSDRNKVIIIHSKGVEVGIISDQVVGVRSIVEKDFQQQLPTMTGVRERYLKGVTRDQMVVLDVDKLLADKTIIIHEEVA
ncbi:MAG: chemotaxis protein CheW [Myxococcota bacterium]